MWQEIYALISAQRSLIRKLQENHENMQRKKAAQSKKTNNTRLVVDSSATGKRESLSNLLEILRDGHYYPAVRHPETYLSEMTGKQSPAWKNYHSETFIQGKACSSRRRNMISEPWSEMQKDMVSRCNTKHTWVSNYLFKIMKIMPNLWGLKN